MDRNNLDPKIWGQYWWPTLYSVGFCYPLENPSDEEKQDAYNFFSSIKSMLPCSNCRNHYKDHLSILPLNDDVLSSRVNLLLWLVDIENEVNKCLKKKTYDRTKRIKYYHKLLTEKQNNNTTYILMISIGLLFLLGYYVIRK